MIENFLHFVWKYKKFDVLNVQTTQRKSLQIVSVGMHNHNSGPDFFNGILRIDEQLWAGNIEMHLKSSDWFVHGHENDQAYDNVILHVVYEHDTEIFRKDGTTIPTLQLKDYIDKNVLKNYKDLFLRQRQWINCEQEFPEVSHFVLQHWIERLYIERLERKSKFIITHLERAKFDWEAVLFRLLAKAFGMTVNGEALFSMANSFDYAVVRKTQAHLNLLEALLFGQSHLLEDGYILLYYQALQKDYAFLKQKFQLDSQGVLPLQFFRLRPQNFPTIRLSQLANLYHRHKNLFSKLNSIQELTEYYECLKVKVTPFWENHYSFKKESKRTAKALTKSFMDHLLVNTILPLKFCYAKQQGKDVNADIFKIMESLKSEQNTIVHGFKSLGFEVASALESQALIQLKTHYCDKNQCLKCAIGNSLLGK